MKVIIRRTGWKARIETSDKVKVLVVERPKRQMQSNCEVRIRCFSEEQIKELMGES